MRWNRLVSGFALLAAAVLACRERVALPEHLEGASPGWVRRHALVRVTERLGGGKYGDGVRGVIVRQFGDETQSGQEVVLAFDYDEVAAGLVVRIEVGETYLFDTLGSSHQLLSRDEGLNLPSTDPHFATYVADLEAAEAALGNARICAARTDWWTQRMLELTNSNVVIDGEEVLSVAGGEEACARVPAGEHRVWAQSPEPYDPNPTDPASWKSEVLAVVLKPVERLDFVICRDDVWVLERPGGWCSTPVGVDPGERPQP